MWPETPCKVCGTPTIDEGGYCSTKCFEADEPEPTLHQLSPEAAQATSDLMNSILTSNVTEDNFYRDCDPGDEHDGD